MTPDWEEKKKYCQAKAANINKSLKAGMQPERGKPKVQQSTSNSQQPLQNSIQTINPQFQPSISPSQPIIPTNPPSQPIVPQYQPPISYQPVPMEQQNEAPKVQAINQSVKFSQYDAQNKITKYHTDYYSIVDKAQKEVENAANELQFKKVKVAKENIKKELELL